MLPFMSELDPVLAARYRALALEALERPASPFGDVPTRLVVVDLGRQSLGFLDSGRLVAEYPISSASAGIGCEEGSYRTPPGWHRIHRRIGEGAPTGMIFRSREATGDIWKGEPRDEDLILTRVLTLEGLEEGVNRGPGRDSRERFIYLHGTNQEARLGTPVSHGCVRLGNAAIIELFDLVQEGDVVLMAPPSDLGLGRIHFAGVGGSGMSALAQYLAMKGGRASGSDRSFDRGLFTESRAKLERLGVAIHPQDGSGVQGDCSAVVYSTAVEESVPDFAQARALGVPLLHRSELLAHFVATQRTIAVTGTSGKSTTTAMIFEILRGAGCDPSVITGGELRALQAEGLWGNAWAGASDLLVIEADESDGSLVHYRPALGVVLNLQKDHKEMDVVAEMFRTFRSRTREGLVIGEAENLAELREGATVFGFGPEAEIRAEDVHDEVEGTRFTSQGVSFQLPVPGRHNLENALAAIAACSRIGVSLEAMVKPLAAFQGVARRFQIVGERRGVTVVDDFGHNPAKVAASLRTARQRAKRVLAIFQPHGFGPLRFLRAEFVEAFATELGLEDRLWFLDVFYAGGTAVKDICSADVVADISARGAKAEYAPSREWLVERMAAEAREGDLVLLMGARDPSLTDLAKAILAALCAYTKEYQEA
jgi:UDP-N-acetylmuramate--L-alanine ligase